jgi:hypothetical protein
MALFDIDWRPADKQLQRFGFYLSAFALLAAGMSIIRANRADATLSVICSPRIILLLILAILAASLGQLRPGWLRPIYISLTAVTAPIRWCVSYVTIMLVYLLVFTPVALVFRVIGRDVLRRRFGRPAATYWVLREQPTSPRSYLKEF